jgi:cytochrome c-type biogenesis protein CcmF
MNSHPMPTFGTLALLLGLMLSAYTLVVGALALWRSRNEVRGSAELAVSGRLQETARRAGISSFIAVSCAAFALVWAAFTNDYSVS